MRRRTVLLGLAVVLALLVGVALLARRVVERSLSSAFSVPVAVGWLWWNPATGTISAGDVALGAEDDRITAERVAFKADLLQVLRGEVSIDRIEVDTPTAALSLGADNQVHFTALAEPGNESPSPASATARRVFVREIDVRGGKLLVHYPVGAVIRTAAIEVGTFTASNLEIDGQPEGTQVNLAGTLEASINGAPVESDVEIRAGRERNIKGKFIVKGLEVSREVLELPAAFSTFTAKVDVEAKLDFTEKRDALQLALRLDSPRFDGAENTSFSAKSIALPDVAVNISDRVIDLGPIKVEAPIVDASFSDAGVVLPGTSAHIDAAPGAAAQPSWSVTSKALAVHGGEIRAHRGENKLSLALESATWEGLRGDRRGQLEVSAKMATGTVAIAGAVASDPLDARLDVRFEKVELAPVVALLSSTPIHLVKGTGEGAIQVTFRDSLQRLSGRAVLRELATAPPDPSRSMEVLAVHAADFAFSYAPAGGTPATRAQIDVPILRLSYPYVMVHRYQAATFPYSLVAGDTGSVPPVAEPSAYVVKVEHFDIEGGKIEYVDSIQEPPYWASLTSVTAGVEQIRYPELSIARLDVTGEHDELSPAEITGRFEAQGFAGRAKARDILLESLNAYVSPALGYSITSGRLSFDASLTSAPPLLQSGTDVVLVDVDVLQTGLDVIQQQSGVPLPVAITLLENRAGEIRLQLPFVVDTASRHVAVGSVVWQAVHSAIIGALTYPLRSLGSLFGTKGAPHAFAVDPVPFAAGSGSLDAAGTARVTEIARIVHAHRSLLLILLAQIDDQDLGVVGRDKAQALADERVAAVRDALVAGDGGSSIAKERVILAPWTPASGASATGKAGVYVELQDGD